MQELVLSNVDDGVLDDLRELATRHGRTPNATYFAVKGSGAARAARGEAIGDSHLSETFGGSSYLSPGYCLRLRP